MIARFELLAAELLRPVVSLDWDDAASLLIAATALIAIFVTKRTSTKSRTHSIEETVDDSVLGKFEQLFERIAALETDLAEALAEIKELKKLEVYLEGKLAEKDKQILNLTARLASAKVRISHLEEMCRAAGINGGDILGSPPQKP